MNKQAGVWVKASERLPDLQKKIVLKHIPSAILYFGNFDRNEEGVWLYIHEQESHKGWAIEDKGYSLSHWQWLDEQPIPVNQDEGYINPEFKDLFEKRIDYSNYEQLAEDIWLFLTDDSRPAKARIKKEALIHEVKTMIESAVLFSHKNDWRYWKQRCDAAEDVLDSLGMDENFSTHRLKESPHFKEEIEAWQQLKSSPSPTSVKNDKKIIREFAFEIALRLTDTLDTVDCSSFSSVAKAVEKTLRQTIFIIGKDPTKTYEPIPDEQPPTPVQEGLREDEKE